MQTTRGTLVECDPTLKEFLRFLGQTHGFILLEIDSTHLLIKPGWEERIHQELSEYHRNNTFVSEDNQLKKK